MELKKHKGSSTTKRGMHFNYIAFRTVERYYDIDADELKTKVIESIYVDEQAPQFKAETLEGLKDLLDAS